MAATGTGDLTVEKELENVLKECERALNLFEQAKSEVLRVKEATERLLDALRRAGACPPKS